MPLCSAASQRMSESDVLSTQEAPKSPPEIELGGKRRKEELWSKFINRMTAG
jgi:hypothetical protein